jgi:cytochrome c-type biogenesis protein CcmH
VRAADGRVAPAAAALFEQALKFDAKDPRARFFLGLVKEQAGNKAAALTDWLAILADASASDASTSTDWVSDLRDRVQSLAQDLGQDVSAAVGQTAVAAVPTAASGGILGRLHADAAKDAAARGPTAADMKAAEALSAADRNAMVQGMVEGLQTRLNASPRDAEGWLKLIRSRMVLGDAAKAKTALDRALTVFADAPVERKLLTDAATELGLKVKSP